jgi:ubiquinone/menaquinone biosynthesis C-methylase UbiE
MSELNSNSNESAAEAGSFYDRIAGLYGLTFKFNGYQRSLRSYLRRNPLPLPRNPRILDAGCGTGLLTMTLLKSLDAPAHITAVDLSASSIETARKAVLESGIIRHEVSFAVANVLELPFDDDAFDFIVTSGALEYVPLGDGIGELARVLKQRGFLLHLPIKPSLISRILEVMFRFKAHSPVEVMENTDRYFRVVRHDEFRPFDPIGWSKTAVLAQKE